MMKKLFYQFLRPSLLLTMMSSWSFGEIIYQGVSLAGAEFHPTTLPGTHGYDYFYPNQAGVDYFMSRDLNTFRLPFRWERLQPLLSGVFDPAELDRLTGFVSSTTAKGATVILDPHNFARYRGKLIGSADVPNAAFSDFWSRLANHFKGNPKVVFGLMHEPHTIPSDQWKNAANDAIIGIRNTGAANLILVCGNGYSIGSAWSQTWYGTSNAVTMLSIADPGNNFAFEVHQYLDADSSGTSSTTVSPTIGSERLVAVTNWMRANGRRGFLGEFGAGGDQVSLSALSNMLTFLRNNSDVWIGWTAWAGGSFWPSDYFMLLEPTGGTDKPQLATISKFAPPVPPSVSLSAGTNEIFFASKESYRYQIQTSSSLATWVPYGSAFNGTGAVLAKPVATADYPRFFRLQITKP